MAANTIKKRRISFKLDAPGAHTVSITADFNNWDPGSHLMKKDKKGIWSKTIFIAPGRHEYKFVVDGEWWNDPRNDQTVFNSFGSINNVLTV